MAMEVLADDPTKLYPTDSNAIGSHLKAVYVVYS